MTSTPASSSTPTTPRPFVQAGDELNAFLHAFWKRQIATAETESLDARHPALPLARIKKVMKSDPEIKHMISADAPLLFCKACEIFIAEVTARAFLNADACKRRTLNKSDVARALAGSDQFDFLIDLVPREDVPDGAKRKNTAEHVPTVPPAQRVAEQAGLATHLPPSEALTNLLHPSTLGPRPSDNLLAAELLAMEQMGDGSAALASPMALDQFLLSPSTPGAAVSPHTPDGAMGISLPLSDGRASSAKEEHVR